MNSLEPYEFPRELLLGTATSALQIEGGDTNNTWYRWSEEGRIKDGSHSVRACDHWNRVMEDIELMREMGIDTYRMGLEWSRIEPAEGVFDEGALEHYRAELAALRDAGITPLVTLHHFSNPLWFEDSGGWARPDAPKLFRRYVSEVVHRLGDLVEDWVTINEPNVYLSFGYIFGIWPPGARNIFLFLRCARRLAQAHLEAYGEIHAVSAQLRREREDAGDRSETMPPPRVGACHHLRIFDPARNHPADRLVAWIYERLFQRVFVRSMTEGRFPFPLFGGIRLRRARREAMREAARDTARRAMQEAARDTVRKAVRAGAAAAGSPRYTSDFFGVNYYSRDMVRFTLDPRQGFGKTELAPNAPVNDMGWEIYPHGLLRVLRAVGKQYGLPIYVTENGTCDNTDRFRSRFIYDHLAAVRQAVAEGVDVRRYYHWSLMDNFEWLEGESARFGLIRIDYDTGRRSFKESGRFFGEICRRRGVTTGMIERYLSRRAG